MCSVLEDSGQLRPLQVMLSDLKTKLGSVTSYHNCSNILTCAYRYQELENRKADKLPPAYGNGKMLGLAGIKERDAPASTTFKLFESQNVAGPSHSIPRPRTHKRGTLRSRKMPQANDNTDDNGNGHFTPSTDDCLPPLPANEALGRAVSEVRLEMAGWEDTHIFKLLIVLMEPPPSLDLTAIEGLGQYLTQLLAQLVKRADNGTRTLATRCCWVLLGKCSTPDISRVDFHNFTAICIRSDQVGKRADWGSLLRILKESRLRLINWCPNVDFPTHKLLKSRPVFRGILNMFFNPDPARRLRLVPIASKSQGLFNLVVVLT
jgi:hypothetical protein